MYPTILILVLIILPTTTDGTISKMEYCRENKYYHSVSSEEIPFLALKVICPYKQHAEYSDIQMNAPIW